MQRAPSPRASRRFTALLATALGVLTLAGCPALYPELGTRTRPIPAGIQLDPPPPSDVMWMRFVSGKVPERTRDGRNWQSSGKGADPFAKLFISGKEAFKTPVQSNTLEPTWPDGPKGNFKIAADDKLRVELWDSKAISDAPIGVKDLGRPSDLQILEHQIRVEFEGGGELLIAYEPAHAVSGLGLWYDLRNEACVVTRMLDGSPAQRAGLLPNDEVLELAGRKVSTMTPDEVKSSFNAPPFDGLTMSVRHPDGATASAKLKEGPIYPLFAQFGPID